jgi:hypothetical protein
MVTSARPLIRPYGRLLFCSAKKLLQKFFGLYGGIYFRYDARDVAQVVLLRCPNDVRRLFTPVESPHGLKQKLPDGDHGDISGSQVFFGTIDDRPHALGGTGVVDQEVFSHSGKGLSLLFLTILEIVVVDIANFDIVGADGACEMRFFLAYRTVAPEKDVESQGVLVIHRNM